MCIAVWLGCCTLLEKPIFLQPVKDMMSDISMPLGCRAPKNIEADVEPVVHLGMHGVELIAQFPGRTAFLLRASFGRGSVFVGP